MALQQISRDGLRSLSCHSSRGRRLPRRDSNLDFLQDTLQERSPELRSLYLEKLVGRGSFGRVYKGEPFLHPTAYLLTKESQMLCCDLTHHARVLEWGWCPIHEPVKGLCMPVGCEAHGHCCHSNDKLFRCLRMPIMHLTCTRAYFGTCATPLMYAFACSQVEGMLSGSEGADSRGQQVCPSQRPSRGGRLPARQPSQRGQAPPLPNACMVQRVCQAST